MGSKMKLLFLYCIISFVSARVVKAAEVLRPRGVPLSKASFYDPTRDFHCLDGSGSIPFSYVNDDYCDCQDGSDEPGTAACPNGFFHCPNAGHKPITIPSSRVNDGICDCCDASDEYASNANCVDTCREMGRAARELAERDRLERQKGHEIRKTMIEEGRKLKKESETKVEDLKRERDSAEQIKSQKEELKKAVEEPEKAALEQYKALEAERKAVELAEKKAKEEDEAREAFAHLDNDGDGILTMLELQSRQTFDTNRDGEVSEDEAKFYLRQEESMDLDTFISTGWMLMRPTYLNDKRMFIPPTPAPSETLEPPPEEFVEQVPEESAEAIDHDLDPEDDEEEEEEEDLYQDYGEAEETEEQQTEEEEVHYDEETQKLVDAANAARAEFDEADKKVRDLVRDLRSLEERQEKDYGPEEEFRVLAGHCYDYTDREYTYQLCPFDKAVQKPKSGHGETRIGQWGEWTGPENNKYAMQKYTNGQACWNGPTRSADVHITCGIETQLTGVAEPNRCEYLFLITTPAACSKLEDLSSEEGSVHEHIEL